LLGVTDEHSEQGSDGGLTVARMAERTGVSAHTLRYYERAGLIRPVRRSAGNHRRYQPEDVEWLRFLLRLRETGMPISRMRRYAELREEGASTLRARMGMLADHHEHLRAQIAVLADHERALEAKVVAYEELIEAHGGQGREGSAGHAGREGPGEASQGERSRTVPGGVRGR
jgi:DNA-binding transcriptional MerR regulator